MDNIKEINEKLYHSHIEAKKSNVRKYSTWDAYKMVINKNYGFKGEMKIRRCRSGYKKKKYCNKKIKNAKRRGIKNLSKNDDYYVVDL